MVMRFITLIIITLNQEQAYVETDDFVSLQQHLIQLHHI